MQHFYELVAAACDQFPADIAIEVQHRDRLEQVSYGRLREMADRTAAWLAMSSRCLWTGCRRMLTTAARLRTWRGRS